MKLVIISGSGRAGSSSLLISRLVEELVIASGLFQETVILELAAIDLALWPSDEDRYAEMVAPRLELATAIVIVCPEWNGMASPAVKNLFVHAGDREFAHKPCLLVGVSSGVGGSYPIAELRMSTAKNSRICYIPETVIFRDVLSMLAPREEISAETSRRSEDMRLRLEYAVRVLHAYALALTEVRRSIADLPNRPENGM